MAKRKALRVVQAGEPAAKLGLVTIMDRTLAAGYGTPYVYMVAFAIDVDRVFHTAPMEMILPFGWEIHLTEAYVLAQLNPKEDEQQLSLLEETCLSILDLDRGDPPLGSQLIFAVYAALERQLLPNSLEPLFNAWRRPPVDLASEMRELAQDSTLRNKLAQHCLDTQLDQPLAPPTMEVLRGWLSEA